MAAPAPLETDREAPVVKMITPGRDAQELWFALARQGWSTLTLVPAEPGSAVALAASLAEIGRLLRLPRVTPISASTLDYGQVSAITNTIGATRAASRSTFQDGSRVVVEIPSVIQEPLGIAVAHASDLVVICVELGKTKLANVRRTVDLIGREKIAGCVVLH